MLIRSCSWGVGGLITDLIRLAFTKVGLLKSVQKKMSKNNEKTFSIYELDLPDPILRVPEPKKLNLSDVCFFCFFFVLLLPNNN